MSADDVRTDEYASDGAPCAYETPNIQGRFWLVGVAGTGLALLSIAENAIVLFVLLKRKHHRKTQNLYLISLSFFDMLLAGAYIPLMSFNLYADYFRSPTLLTAWFHYMTPAITISHIAMSSTSFTIVAATVERHVVTAAKANATAFVCKHRPKIAVAAIFLGCVTRFSIAFELTWAYREECAGHMSQWVINVSAFARNEPYHTYWKVVGRNVVTVLIPFFLLLALNIRILHVLHNAPVTHLRVQKLSDAKRKQQIRAATMTMILVVFTYLMSNLPNVIITIWEYIDADSLFTEKFADFYTYSVDVISMLTVFGGFLRPPIYISCQEQLKKEFAALLRQCFYGSNHKGYDKAHMSNGAAACLGSTADLEPANGDADCGGEYANLLIAIGTALLHNTQSIVGPAPQQTIMTSALSIDDDDDDDKSHEIFAIDASRTQDAQEEMV